MTEQVPAAVVSGDSPVAAGEAAFSSAPSPADRRRSEWAETRALLEWEMRHYMDSDRKAFLEGVRWGMKRSAELTKGIA